MLDLNQIIELKNILAESDVATIHMHDTCGGQYFTIQDQTEKTKGIIIDYLKSIGQTAYFADDGQSFTVK